uniref:Serotriflin n=1 Tax=Xenopus tropicalis TaxID=8364 RepID=A0A803KAI3_XENTR
MKCLQSSHSNWVGNSQTKLHIARETMPRATNAPLRPTGTMMPLVVLCILFFSQYGAVPIIVPYETQSTDNATNRQIIVDVHNRWRGNVTPTAMNMLKMEWNDEAAKKAEIWARTCNQFHNPASQRNITNFSCGQNLFMASYSTTWEAAVTAWFDEIKDFDFGKGPKTFGALIGHYTQGAWYNSRMVGCYEFECPNAEYRYYYVCHYCPAGNIEGKQFTPYKIGPTCGDCPKSCENGVCTNYCPHPINYDNCQELTTKYSCSKYPELQDDCPAHCRCTNNEII